MQFRTPKNILTLIGGMTAGMAVGGAAMFLFDPVAGRRRRAAIADAADYAAHHAGAAVHSAGDAIHDAAISAGEKIGDAAARARRAGQRAAHAAGHATRQAAAAATAAAPGAVELGHATAATAVGLRRLVDSYHDSAHYLAGRVDQLRQNLESRNPVAHGSHPSHFFHAPALLGSLATGAKSALTHLAAVRIQPGKRSLRFIPLSVGGVACLAAGAGAMYYFDPERGRDRRKSVRDGVIGAAGKVGRFARHRGKNVRRNVHAVARQVGLAAPAPQQRISSEGYVSGEQLLLRVRSAIARAAGNPRTIQVMTDAAGAVTLTGVILDSERARVLKAVGETPGVRGVIDRLREQSTPGANVSPARQ